MDVGWWDGATRGAAATPSGDNRSKAASRHGRTEQVAASRRSKTRPFLSAQTHAAVSLSYAHDAKQIIVYEPGVIHVADPLGPRWGEHAGRSGDVTA